MGCEHAARGSQRQPGQAKGGGLNNFKLGSDVSRLAHLEDPTSLVRITGWREEGGGPRGGGCPGVRMSAGRMELQVPKGAGYGKLTGRGSKEEAQ